MTRHDDLERLITTERAIAVASALFPWEYAPDPPFDCRREHGRVGQPCLICAAHNERWLERVAQVREAMILAFR